MKNFEGEALSYSEMYSELFRYQITYYLSNILLFIFLSICMSNIFFSWFSDLCCDIDESSKEYVSIIRAAEDVFEQSESVLTDDEVIVKKDGVSYSLTKSSITAEISEYNIKLKGHLIDGRWHFSHEIMPSFFVSFISLISAVIFSIIVVFSVWYICCKLSD